MGKQIDLGKKLSKSDWDYLAARSGSQRTAIAENVRRFGLPDGVERKPWMPPTQDELEGDTSWPPEQASKKSNQAYDDSDEEDDDTETDGDPLSDQEFVWSLNVAELEAELEERQLNKSGKKAELRDRLLEAIQKENAEQPPE